MNAAGHIARLRAARQSWVELEPGKRVQILRPAEAELQDFYTRPEQTEIDRALLCARKYVTGWEGVTEADLLGAAIAAPDPVPFDADLWAEVVKDRMDWLGVVSQALLAAIRLHEETKAAAAKN